MKAGPMSDLDRSRVECRIYSVLLILIINPGDVVDLHHSLSII